MQGREAGGLSLGRSVFFLEDRSEDGEVHFLRFGAAYFGGIVAGGGYQKGFRVQRTVSDF